MRGTAEKTFLLSELSELLSYISRHYTEDITIEDLCGVSNMSKSTLQRKMTAGIGYSPLQYVQRLRTSHAAVLLQDKAAHSAITSLTMWYRAGSS